jgi:hypothetical protein
MADNNEMDGCGGFRVEGSPDNKSGWEVAKHNYPLRIDKPIVITMNGKRRVSVKIKTKK